MTLAQRIEHDLIRLLAKREALPFKLSLSGIARHYGASQMPARVAVQLLVDSGVLNKSETGRLSINHDKLPQLDELPTVDDHDQASLKDRLVEEIIRCGLAHDENYLRESATAEQYGVGRTVVRRIFSELAGRGLLVHVPRCGWQVRPYREQDTIDYLVVRAMLERKAVELSFEKLDPARLLEYRAGNRLSEPGRPAQLDNRMHAYWVGLSGNRYIQSFFEREGDYYASIFDYAGLDPEATDLMAHQHHTILDALLAQDLPAALDALSQHIQHQSENVSRMIRQQKTDDKY